MKSQNRIIMHILCSIILLLGITGCKKENENYPPIPEAVYVVAEVVTGPFPGSATAVSNTATGSIKVSPMKARVYVNTPKERDITINYTISGTAVAGTHYVLPQNQSITIPAGQWFGRIEIPTISGTLTSNKTVIITLETSDENIQLGLGLKRTHKTFTYTLTN